MVTLTRRKELIIETIIDFHQLRETGWHIEDFRPRRSQQNLKIPNCKGCQPPNGDCHTFITANRCRLVEPIPR